jgi:hypothetical protein
VPQKEHLELINVIFRLCYQKTFQGKISPNLAALDVAEGQKAFIHKTPSLLSVHYEAAQG